MKTTYSIAIVLASLIVGAYGQTSNPPIGNLPHGSIQVSLTTSGYHFDIIHYNNFTNVLVDPVGPVILPLSTAAGQISEPSPLGSISPIPLAFEATFTLKNDIAPHMFSFPWAYWVTNKIVFTVYDTNNDVVWTSTVIPVDLPPILHLVTATLGSNQAWSKSVLVPLEVKGIPLWNGVYRLEATITGSPLFSVNSSFEVQNLTAGPIKNPFLIAPH